MLTRETVRLIVLNSRQQLLLLRLEDDSVAQGPAGTGGGAAGAAGGAADARADAVDAAANGAIRSFWITPGGRLEPGETVQEAAIRELGEETGLTGTPPRPLWYAEQTLAVHGEITLFKETYMLVEVSCSELTAVNQTEEEKRVVKEMRWWQMEELRTSQESIFPIGLAALLESHKTQLPLNAFSALDYGSESRQ